MTIEEFRMQAAAMLRDKAAQQAMNSGFQTTADLGTYRYGAGVAGGYALAAKFLEDFGKETDDKEGEE